MIDSERQSLEDALAALKAGDRKTAGGLFSAILRANPDQAEAWVGLSLCTARPERRREYLQRALRIDPGHVYARAALARLQSVPAPQRPVAAAAMPAPPTDPRVQRRWLEVYLGLGLALLLLFAAVFGMGYFYNQQVQQRRIASLPVELNPDRYVFIDFYADW